MQYSTRLAVTLTFDLMPWEPFQQCLLTWWMFAASFIALSALGLSKEISRNGKRTDDQPDWRPVIIMPSPATVDEGIKPSQLRSCLCVCCRYDTRTQRVNGAGLPAAERILPHKIPIWIPGNLCILLFTSRRFDVRVYIHSSLLLTDDFEVSVSLKDVCEFTNRTYSRGSGTPRRA